MRREGVGERGRIWIFEAATSKIPAETCGDARSPCTSAKRRKSGTRSLLTEIPVRPLRCFVAPK
jgi:hypothetical protein